MSPKELFNMLKILFAAREPVLITGAPGEGKTDIVDSAAEAIDYELIIRHPVVDDPTDYKGLPGVVNGKAEFLPFGDLSALMEVKEPTVCFLDDLGQAPAVVQAAAMQLILARRINGHKISSKVVFCAATNRRQDRAGVTGILEPVKSRFATIVELKNSVDDWIEWAFAHKVPPELIAFQQLRQDLFHDKAGPTAEIVNRPSPRTITNMGRLYKLGFDSLEVLAGAVGQGYAGEFLAFIGVMKELPTIESILNDPEGARIPKEASALYAVASVAATRTTKENSAKVMTYLVRLPKEFAALGILGAHRICSHVANNRLFQKWCAENTDYTV